ncbi:outer membrane beta-barrel protein [Methylobacterium nodulans]|uniref:outer membrane beta-barrel protein n=1 Tax=Methylobacterium nodulans TaxID=114616 RepID=UPI001FCC17F0|nr:outer membrane beta-barrel protein [Methylobacterium nodulans]
MAERPRVRLRRGAARRRGASGLALAALALLSGAASAQTLPSLGSDPGLGTSLDRDGSTGGRPAPPGAAGLRGSSDPTLRAAGIRGAGAGERSRTPPRRRSRPPTAASIRQATQLPVPDARLRPAVQEPVTVLPDPVLAGPLLRRRPIDPTDPYAPLGLRVGGLTLFPALQQSIGYDTNPDRTARGKGSLALRTDGELGFQSDWSAHSLTGALRGGYSDYPDNRAASRPDGDGAFLLRLDASRDTRFEVEGRYAITTQRAGSPDLNAQLRERPIVAAYGGSVGVVQDFNRLQVALRGVVARETYDDAQLANGGVQRQADRNANTYGLRLRTGYEIRPGFTPFVDVLVDTRIHDYAVDFSGYRRNSDGLTLRAGSTFELSRILTGEVSGGYLRRSYADSRLRDVTGPVFDGALAWAATPLTTLRLTASTGVIETVVPNASGVLTQAIGAELIHDLRRNLRLTLIGTLYSNDYQGVGIREDGYLAGLKIDYRLNRWLGIRVSYAHENLHSTSAGSSYAADTVLVGLRVNP